MSRDVLAPFDGAVVSEVAAEHDLPEERLVSLLREQQERVRSLRSVDGMVFEYRKEFARQPVVEKRAAAYYLLVPVHVWPEFGEALDCSTAELSALRDVHARTFRDALGDWEVRETAADRAQAGQQDDDREPLVFTRP